MRAASPRALPERTEHPTALGECCLDRMNSPVHGKSHSCGRPAGPSASVSYSRSRLALPRAATLSPSPPTRRGDLPVDLRLLSPLRLPTPLDRRTNTLSTLHLPLLCNPFAFVRDPVPLVRGTLPHVGQTRALVSAFDGGAGVHPRSSTWSILYR